MIAQILGDRWVSNYVAATGKPPVVIES
jgi:hypothetical protein